MSLFSLLQIDKIMSSIDAGITTGLEEINGSIASKKEMAYLFSLNMMFSLNIFLGVSSYLAGEYAVRLCTLIWE